MHCNTVTYATILYHFDDDADLPYNCNVFTSFISVSCLPSFK